MASLKQAKSPEDIKKLGVGAVREAYIDLAKQYNQIIDGDLYYCHKCNGFYKAEAFYNDARFASGLFPICKKCMLDLATDYDKKEKIHIDNREKTIAAFQMMDLPFIDSLYQSALKTVAEAMGEKNRSTAYQHTLVMVKTLDQYKRKKWKDSEFDEADEDGMSDEEINENSRIMRAARKRFGKDYSPADLLFLENEYEDWVKRYPCENKAQEVLYKRICHIQLAIDQAQKRNDDTKDLDKSLQELMTSLAIKPSSSNSNALTEAKTFGQLIQKWEEEKPIPEPEEEFRDIDKIGLYIDVFFKGHLAKMMGLKNGFSSLYEKFMKRFSVSKPEYEEDADSEALFDQIFGSHLEDDG